VEITFVGHGNARPSTCHIVSKSTDASTFAKQFVDLSTRDNVLKKPEVIISITGGAQDFTMPANLKEVFNRGLLRVAQNTRAWIVTGGLSSGVMEFVGNALWEVNFSIPCIGVATYSKVSNHKSLESGGPVAYKPEKENDAKSASLQKDHTHFILVKSDVDEWGQEIEFRTALEHHISTQLKIPIVLVALNGGPNTITTLVEGARKQFPILIVAGSGRACDEMTSYLNHKIDNKRYPEPVAWNELMNRTQDQQKRVAYTAQMEELFNYRERITVYDPAEKSDEDFDKPILKSILNLKDEYERMQLIVQWGRDDLIEVKDIDNNRVRALRNKKKEKKKRTSQVKK